MKLADKFNNFVDTAFPDQLFDPKSRCEISNAEVRGYVGERFDTSGDVLPPFGKEREVFDAVIAETNGQSRTKTTVVLVGDAGSGKSTFVRFVFGFYRKWRDEIAMYGLSECLERIERSTAKKVDDNMIFLFADVPETADDTNATFDGICTLLRDQIIANKTITTLWKENDYAMVDEQRSARGEGVNQAVLDDLKRYTQELLGPSKKREFIKFAIDYLVNRRDPVGNRKSVAIVIDDSDLVEPSKMRSLMGMFEALLPSRGREGSAKSAKLVITLRPDSLSLRKELHQSTSGLTIIPLGSVNSEKVLIRRNACFLESISNSVEELPTTVSKGQFTYSVPVPTPKVRQLAQSTCEIASGMISNSSIIDLDGTNYIFKQIIHPLCGSSIRRLQYFQKRILCNGVIDEKLRHELRIGNSDLFEAALTGSDGKPSSLSDRDSVGLWYCSTDLGCRRFLSPVAVLSLLSHSRNGIVPLSELYGALEVLGFLDGQQWVEELVLRGFVERPSPHLEVNNVLKFNVDTIRALIRTIHNPTYVELVGLMERRKDRKRKNSTLAVNSDCAIQVIRNILKMESQWSAVVKNKIFSGQVSNGEKEVFFEVLDKWKMMRLGKKCYDAYTTRLQQLLKNGPNGQLRVSEENAAVATSKLIELETMKRNKANQELLFGEYWKREHFENR